MTHGHYGKIFHAMFLKKEVNAGKKGLLRSLQDFKCVSIAGQTYVPEVLNPAIEL